MSNPTANQTARKLSAHAGDAGADERLVDDDTQRESYQERGEGRQSRPLCHVPDGRGRHSAKPVGLHLADDRRAATAATGRAWNAWSVRVSCARAKLTGEVRRDDGKRNVLGRRAQRRSAQIPNRRGGLVNPACQKPPVGADLARNHWTSGECGLREITVINEFDNEQKAMPEISLDEIEARLKKILDTLIIAEARDQMPSASDLHKMREEFFLSANSHNLMEFIIYVESEFEFELEDGAVAISRGYSFNDWAQFLLKRLHSNCS